jgi:polysaccharide export outer membrane protein
MRQLGFISLIAILLLTVGRVPVHAAAPYTLSPEDVIDVAVLNHEDLDRTLTVLPDGSITYLWAGKFMAAGSSPDDLGARIRKSLEKRYNNVAVSITVKQIHAVRARVTGAVNKPGVYDIKPNWRVLDLVAAAGGFSARPLQIDGRIVRGDGRVVPVNIAHAVAEPSGDENLALGSEDLVLLDQRDPSRNRVFVMGQVSRPGAYDLGDEGLSLFSLLSQAGNPAVDAALTRAYVLRGREEIPLDLRPALVDGKADRTVQGFTLQAGDVLFIPQIQERIAVIGEVNRPGAYVLPEKPRFSALDALSLAGGQTQNGDLRQARIIRTTGGKIALLPLDLDKLGKSGVSDDRLVLQPDDVVYVAARNQKFTLRDALSSLAYLGVRLLR